MKKFLIDPENPLVLGSQSPRRKQLLQQAGIPLITFAPDVEETFDQNLPAAQVPLSIAQKKAIAVQTQYPQHALLTADTVVIANNRILGKPNNEEEAFRFLSELQNNSHLVVTGVCIQKEDNQVEFSVSTEVWFRPLQEKELWHYIHTYKPYDKAGAYGIQEWIGLVGVTKIVGDYYNVMGLPVSSIMPHLEVIY